MKQSCLSIVPVTSADANVFVARYHRHHKPLTLGYVFSLAVADDAGDIRGVAIVGRPAARMTWDGWTLEVRRVATDGCPNACSALYGAAWRVCKGLGYRRLVTYILSTEPGTTLKAAGWKCLGEAGGGTWNRPNADRPRIDKHPTQTKLLWEATP